MFRAVKNFVSAVVSWLVFFLVSGLVYSIAVYVFPSFPFMLKSILFAETALILLLMYLILGSSIFVLFDAPLLWLRIAVFTSVGSAIWVHYSNEYVLFLENSWNVGLPNNIFLIESLNHSRFFEADLSTYPDLVKQSYILIWDSFVSLLNSFWNFFVVLFNTIFPDTLTPDAIKQWAENLASTISFDVSLPVIGNVDFENTYVKIGVWIGRAVIAGLIIQLVWALRPKFLKKITQ